MGVIFSAMNRDHNLCGIREVMVGGPAGAGRLWDWKRNRKPSPRRRLKQWLKHQKENLRLVILLHLLPPPPPSSLFKKETVSNTLTAAFQFRLHKWDEVRGGVAGVAANSIRSFFWLCSMVPLILNSKCGHLKNPKSFIHWSDCETCRW